MSKGFKTQGSEGTRLCSAVEQRIAEIDDVRCLAGGESRLNSVIPRASWLAAGFPRIVGCDGSRRGPLV
jgi:hypothetical protein